MRWSMVRRSDSGGFTLIEMLVVVALLLILGTLALGYYQGIRTKRMRMEVVNSLPGLRAFETVWWDRTGGYLYSDSSLLDTDRVRWNNVSSTNCSGRITTNTFQIQIADESVGWSPEGCQWEYFVIDDRCASDCADGGSNDACQGNGNCYCAIGEVDRKAS